MMPIPKVQAADLQTYFAAADRSCGSILVPQPQRPAMVQGFIEATRNETADRYDRWHTSKGYRSVREMTESEYPSTKLGDIFHFPEISTSTSIARQSPRRLPTHAAASCDQSQTVMSSIQRVDVSDPFAPGFLPAGWATQTSGPPPNMPSASSRGSLFGSLSSLTYPDESDYGAMPEPERDPGFTRAGNDLSIPIALSHLELAGQFGRSDSPDRSSPPPAYGSAHNTASLYPPMNSSAPFRSRNSFYQPLPVASFYTPTSFAGGESRRGLWPNRSWGSEDELRFASISPSAQLRQHPVSHVDIRVDRNVLSPSKESRADTRNRLTRNKMSIWDRLTSRASTFLFGKGPKHRWP